MDENRADVTELAAPTVEIELLGAPRLVVDGQDATPTRGRVLQALALLAAAGGFVTVERLVDELWGGRPPADPRGAFRVVISRLRSALGPAADRLRSTSGGYELAADRVDLVEFEALVQEARAVDSPTGRADLLDRALGVWRGTPFAGIDTTPGLELRSHELTALHAAAVTDAARLALERGDPEGALARLDRWPVAFVADERRARIRASALAALGRRAEALAVLDEVRRELRQVFGLDPSPPTRALEREVLEGEVDIGGAEPARIANAALFVGRDEELAFLSAAGPGEWRLVVGPRGRGKSALAREFVARRRREGWCVLAATASRVPGRPLEVASELVAAAALGNPEVLDDPLRRRVHDWLTGDPATGVAPPSREAIIDAAAGLLTAGADRVALVVDDAQWVDAVSAAIVSGAAGLGAAVSVFVRDDDRGNAGTGWLSELEAGARLELDVLADADAEALVAAVAPRLAARDRRRLVAWCGGDPLFLVLSAELVAEGALVDEHLPASVLLVVRERLDALALPARRTMEVAAVLGRRFPLSVLRRLRPDADADLDAARRAGLVELDDDHTGRFRHELVRDAAYEMLGAGMRAALHDEIARLLEEDGAPPTEIVGHARGAAVVDPARALAVELAAAAQHMRSYVWAAALEHLEAAEVLLDRVGGRGGPAELRLLLDRGRALRLAHGEGSHEALHRAVELSRRLGDDDAFVAAVTELCDLGPASGVGEVDAELVDLLDAALDRLVSAPRRVGLLLAGTRLLAFVDDERARDLYREARRLAGGDGELEAAVLMAAHLGLSHPGDLAERRRAAERLAAASGDDTSMAWEAAFLAYGVGLVAGERELVETSIGRLRELTERVVQRPRFFGHHFTEASYAHLTGDLDAAEAHACRAVEVGSRIYPVSRVHAVFSGITLAVGTARGTRAELTDAVEELVADAPGSITWRTVAATLAADRGDLEAARRHLAPVTAADFGSADPGLTWTALAVLAAQAVVAVGDPTAAARLATLLGPHTGTMSWDSVCAHGPVDGALALLHELLGDGEAAACHRRRAGELLAGLGAAPGLWPWLG